MFCFVNQELFLKTKFLKVWAWKALVPSWKRRLRIIYQVSHMAFKVWVLEESSVIESGVEWLHVQVRRGALHLGQLIFKVAYKMLLSHGESNILPTCKMRKRSRRRPGEVKRLGQGYREGKRVVVRVEATRSCWHQAMLRSWFWPLKEDSTKTGGFLKVLENIGFQGRFSKWRCPRGKAAV